MKGYKKIGNTSFRQESIKKMNFKEFEETYKSVLKGSTTKEAYEELTGSKLGKPDETVKSKS